LEGVKYLVNCIEKNKIFFPLQVNIYEDCAKDPMQSPIVYFLFVKYCNQNKKSSVETMLLTFSLECVKSNLNLQKESHRPNNYPVKQSVPV
jgi:hypothetical protein